MGIQVYGGPQVGRGVINNPGVRARAVAASFGGAQNDDLKALGEGVGDLSKAVGNYAIQKGEQEAKTEARDTYTQSSAKMREALTPMLSLKGKNALDAMKKAQDEIARIKAEDSKNLGDYGKSLYDASFDSDASHYLGSIMSHQEQERVAYDKDTKLADNFNAKNNAIALKNNPITTDAQGNKINIFEESEARILANTRSVHDGASPEEMKMREIEAVNDLYSSIAEAKAQESPTSAINFAQEHKDKFAPATFDKYVHGLKENAVLEQSKAQVDKLSSLSLDKGLEIANAIKDPKLSSLVAKGLRERADDKAAAQALVEKQNYATVFNSLVKDPTKTSIPNSLSPEHQKSLMELQKKFATEEKAKKGLAVAEETDWLVYTELKKLSPKERAATDLTKYIGSLAAPEYKELMKLQESDSGGSSAHALFDTRVKGLKDLNPSKATSGGENAERYNRAAEEFNTRWNSLKPEEQTDEKANEILNHMLAPVTNPGAFLWGTTYRFEAAHLNKLKADKEMLKKIPGLKYDEGTGFHYVDGDGVRNVYDDSGKLVKRYVRKVR